MAEFDVRQWLRMLALEEYADKFRSNGYRSFEDLLRLTEDSLKQLGVGSFVVRDRLLRAVEKLKSQGKEPATQALPQDLLVSVQTRIKYNI